MSFLFKNKKPRSKLGFITAFLLIMIVLTSLGVWQLRRAGEKQAIEMALKERGNRKPPQIGNTQLQAVDGEYRKGIAQGRFDNKHTLFLDNQVYRGQAG